MISQACIVTVPASYNNSKFTEMLNKGIIQSRHPTQNYNFTYMNISPQHYTHNTAWKEWAWNKTKISSMSVVRWQPARGATACHLRSDQMVWHIAVSYRCALHVPFYCITRNLKMEPCINFRFCVKLGKTPLWHATDSSWGIMLCHEHKHSWFTHFHKNREDNGWQKNGLQHVGQSAQFIARDQVTQWR
jgi:hypothetical protein